MSDPTPPTGSPHSNRTDRAATKPATAVPSDLAETVPFTADPSDLAKTQPLTAVPFDEAVTKLATVVPRDLAATQPFTAVPSDLASTQPFTSAPADLAATQSTQAPSVRPLTTSVQDLTATRPLTSAPLDGTRGTMPGAPGAGPVGSGPDFVATRLITDTSVPKPDLEATRATQPVDQQDNVATIARSSPNDQATIAFKPDQTAPFPSTAPSRPSASPQGTRPTSPGDRTPLGTGSLLRTSFTQRVGRTKINSSLNAESQTLDAKLQISRPSVLADLAASREGEALPPGVRRLIAEQGTEGRYAINRELAHGGMGAVLDISDHDFRRKAAMKVILARFARSPEAVERFLAEAQVTAQLEHPNIVPIHDLGVMEDGTLYFTMKMIEGQSLGKVVKTLQQDHGLLKLKDGELAKPDAASREATAHWTEQEKLHVFLKVLDGVGFAHARGVIHRDIKPDNIMLGGHGEVLVVDWGIAKILGAPETLPSGDGLTMAAPGTVSISKPAATGVVSIRSEEASAATIAGSAMGTIYYMPPEQAQGALDEMDARSDIYALGATLYELLALKRCLVGSSLAEMLVKIVEGQWVSLSDADPTIHPDLVAIVHRSMARESKNRYQTCDDFSSDLRRYLAGQAVAARKRSAGEVIRLWIKEHRTRLIAGAVAIVLMIAVAYGTALKLSAMGAEKDRATLEQVKQDFASQKPQDLESLTAMLTTVRNLGHGIENEQQTKDLGDLISQAVYQAKADEKAKAEHDVKVASAADDIARAKAAEARDDAKGLRDAIGYYQEAVDATPDNQVAEQGLVEAKQLLNNHEYQERKGTLTDFAQRAAAGLDKAATLSPLDPLMANLEHDIDSNLNSADADATIKIEGTSVLATRLEQLRQRIKSAESAAQYQAHANDLVRKAAAALAAQDTTLAVSQARGALAFAPTDPNVLAIYGQATAAKALADERSQERQRRADAEGAAARTLSAAQVALDNLSRSRLAYQEALNEYQKLQQSLVDKPLEDQKPAFQANQVAEQGKQAMLSYFTSCEDQAQKTITLLEPWAHETPIPTAYRQAQGILATLYQQRLDEAVRANRSEEIGVYRGLLARADAYNHVYAADLSNNAQVTITAPAGTGPIIARQLGLYPDTRIGPVGQPLTVPAGQAVTLPPGSWQFTSAATTISALLNPLHPTAIAWPAATPQPGGIPLLYVPADLHRTPDGRPGGLRPFFLGATEVTNAQYLAFLKDSAIFDQVAKSFHHNAIKVQSGDNDPGPVVLVPGMGTKTVFSLIPASDPNQLSDITLDQCDPRQPVAFIGRADAEAFCAWLSKKYNLTVRLPYEAEWRFAANGDDPQRIFPWGPHFNGNFCVSSGATKQQDPTRVGTNLYDVGPFGHRDLAGNVREWLRDRPTGDNPRAAGANGALIAGGSVQDDNELWFKCDYAESVDPSVRYPVIGFRILVEVP